MNNTDTARADKIAKLLAKAERAATEHEADAFFSKAQDLIARWQIDEAMIFAAQGATHTNDQIVTEEIPVKRSGYFDSMAQLWAQVADANGVKVLRMTPAQWGTRAGVQLIGWESDIRRVKLLYTSLLAQCVRGRVRDLPEEYRLYVDGGKSIARWRLAYAMSYATRVGQRLREQVKRTQNLASTENDKFLPAVIDRKQAVDNYMENIPTKRINSRSKNYDRNGWSAGHAAAERSDIGNTRVGDTRTAINK